MNSQSENETPHWDDGAYKEEKNEEPELKEDSNGSQIDTKLFIKRSRKHFDNKFDYSKTSYEGSKKKLTITCKEHGDFEITPSNHYQQVNGGCSYCAKTHHKSYDEIQEIIRHEGFQPTENTENMYENSKSKIEVCCPVHSTIFSIHCITLTQPNRKPLCKKCINEKIFDFMKQRNELVRKTREMFLDNLFPHPVYTKYVYNFNDKHVYRTTTGGGRKGGTINRPRRIIGTNRVGYYELKLSTPDGYKSISKHKFIYECCTQQIIPPGHTYEIDHFDGNPSNNDITNLTLLDKKLHGQKTALYQEKKKSLSVENLEKEYITSRGQEPESYEDEDGNILYISEYENDNSGDDAELWKRCLHDENILVSDRGRVRNFSSNKNKITYGHLNIREYYVYNGIFVHKLVLEAFVGKCPPEHSIDHINRQKNDNRLSNLRYLSIKEQNINQERIQKLTLITYNGFTGKIDKSFKTIKEATEHYNITYTGLHNISHCNDWFLCRNNTKEELNYKRLKFVRKKLNKNVFDNYNDQTKDMYNIHKRKDSKYGFYLRIPITRTKFFREKSTKLRTISKPLEELKEYRKQDFAAIIIQCYYKSWMVFRDILSNL
jgi:hypothetical protein